MKIQPVYLVLLILVAVGSAVGGYFRERALVAELVAAREAAAVLADRLNVVGAEARHAAGEAAVAIGRDRERQAELVAVRAAADRAAATFRARRAAIDTTAGLATERAGYRAALDAAAFTQDSLQLAVVLEARRADSLLMDLERARDALDRTATQVQDAATQAARLAARLPVRVGRPPPRLAVVAGLRQIVGTPLEASLGVKSGLLEVGARQAVNASWAPQAYVAVRADVRLF